MVIWLCECGYTWIIESSIIPQSIIGPIFSPDSVVRDYWMNKPQEMSAHQWYENYGDCAHRFMKEQFK